MLDDLCFEIIETCPNNCLFCSSCSNLTKIRQIDFAMFKKVIDYLSDNYGIKEISLSGGEPLLHQDLFKMINYCKEKNIRTVLFTSGIKRRKKMSDKEKVKLKLNLEKEYNSYLKEGMPKDEFAKFIEKQLSIYLRYDAMDFDSLSTMDCNILKEIGLDKIVFDFQAWNREVYDKIMGTKDLFDLVTTSMIKASCANLVTDAHFIPTKINYKEIKDIIEMLNIAGFKELSILNFVPQGRGNTNKDNLSLSEDEFKEFLKIYEECKKDFKGTLRIGIPFQENDTHKCTAGLSKLVIKYDGTVLPCPAFKEYDLKKLNSLGIKTPNIYTNLEDISINRGTRSKPLCKRLYNFNKTIN